MSEQQSMKKIYESASALKTVLLENNNIDILLYLAKYNPKIDQNEIITKFGKDAKRSLEDLKGLNLVNEDQNHRLTLTDLGLFQVEGLLALAV